MLNLPRARWATGSVCLLLATLTLALYWPVRHFAFIQFDDPEYISENSVVRAGLTWSGLVWSLVDAHFSNWHPVTWLSHMLDCQLFGLNPGAHHLVNVLFHAANAALLFLLLRNLTGALWRSAFVAAVFAWHPLRVESVAWLAERKDVLSAFFFFLTLLAYVQYVQAGRNKTTEHEAASMESPSPSSPLSAPRSHLLSPISYLLSLAFFSLGLMSKPMLITVPLLLLLLDYWPLKRIPAPKTQGSRSVWLVLVREKIPFFLLSFLVGLVAFFAQKQGGALVPLKAEGLAFRLESALSGYLQYLGKIFWPSNLSFLYLRPERIPLGLAALALLILALVSVWVFRDRVRRRYLVVGWLWFLLMLLPVSGLMQTGLQSIADRYTYLPAIGLALMVGWGAADLAGPLPRRRAWHCLLGVAALCSLVLCAQATYRQLAFWRNTETLMERALQLDPNNYVAHNLLADYFTRLNRPEEARQHRQRFRELAPPLGTSRVTTRPLPPSKPE
jgi:hypothetical protein